MNKRLASSIALILLIVFLFLSVIPSAFMETLWVSKTDEKTEATYYERIESGTPVFLYEWFPSLPVIGILSVISIVVFILQIKGRNGKMITVLSFVPILLFVFILFYGLWRTATVVNGVYSISQGFDASQSMNSSQIQIYMVPIQKRYTMYWGYIAAELDLAVVSFLSLYIALGKDKVKN